MPEMQGAKMNVKWIREILRLKLQCRLGVNEIARCLKRSSSTVSKYVQAASRAGLDEFELLEILSDSELEQALQTCQRDEEKRVLSKDEPDWKKVHEDLKQKGVTLVLLYNEYVAQAKSPLGRTTYYRKYKQWAKSQNVTMVFEHKPGEKLFVDYSGLTMELHDPISKRKRKVQLFVGDLGHSDLIFCEPTFSQGSEDWLRAHVECFHWLGGCPSIVVPDNLKSGVKTPCRYEPSINQSYQELAQHYAVAVIPARVRKPRDKARVEKAVQTVQREIAAPLRNQVFYSLAEMKQAIREKLEILNNRNFQKEDTSRREKFEAVERHCLRALPQEKFSPHLWKWATVHIDYHVELDRKYYSVPFELCGKRVQIRYNQNTVEIFCESKRICAHKRISPELSRKFCTLPEHMPPAHQEHVKWTPDRLLSWALEFGTSTRKYIQRILENPQHHEQGFRAALGVFQLSKKYSREEFENACKSALYSEVYSYQFLKRVLQGELETKKHSGNEEVHKPIYHLNIRGGDYYKTKGEKKC